MANKIFVGNLDFQTSEDTVRTLFEQVGPVSEVFLPTDRATGRPRGFAFVEYGSPDEVQEAIEKFDGHELEGRPLRVNEATDRPPRAPRGGGFGGGGYGGGRGGGGGGGGRPSKPKGSRRGARGKKRSL